VTEKKKNQGHEGKVPSNQPFIELENRFSTQEEVKRKGETKKEAGQREKRKNRRFERTNREKSWEGDAVPALEKRKVDENKRGTWYAKKESDETFFPSSDLQRRKRRRLAGGAKSQAEILRSWGTHKASCCW